jgi:archaellum component FlaC
MDFDKKYTDENEFENEQASDTQSDNKAPVSEFDEFNFTDDFPDEFSEEFMKKPDDMPKEEELYNPDADFDDDFTTPSNETPKEEPYNPDADFDEDFFSSKTTSDTSNVTTDPDLDNLDLDSEAVLPPVTTERKGNFFKRHPWFTLIIFLVMLYGGYKLLQGTGNQEITPVPNANITSAKQATPVASGGSVEIRQIDERLNTIEQAMNVLNDQLTQLQGAHVRLDQMEQMISKIADEESTLQDTLTRLEALDKQITALNALNQRMNTLEAEVGVVADEVKLHITVSEQTQRAANLSRQAMQAKSMIPIPMVVQAAIPGRAWLMSESGELISVARGDDVPGYGRVMNIDPVAGTVTMSSETVFREEE